MVYRNGTWFKLLNSGVSSKMVNMLQSIYKSVKSCVKVNGHLRCSAHKLAIEEGRFRNIDRAQRKCNMCNMGCIDN